MPGRLLPCPVGTDRKFALTFWTVERNPAISKGDMGLHKLSLARCFRKLNPGAKILVASEVSNTGYHHDHVVQLTPQRKAVTYRAVNAIRKHNVFIKTNGTAVSVRAFHTKSGANENYADLCKYLTTPGTRPKALDDDTLAFDDIGPRVTAAFQAQRKYLDHSVDGNPNTMVGPFCYDKNDGSWIGYYEAILARIDQTLQNSHLFDLVAEYKAAYPEGEVL